MIKTFFHNDLDGKCAGAIVNFFYKKAPELEFIEVDYKDVINIEAIKENEKVIIVDFSFTPNVMKRILERTKDVIWLDHHKTAKDYDYGIELEGLRNFEDKKLSGCELTWKYFYGNKAMPVGVYLIGDRDCWRWADRERSERYNQGIRMYPHQPQDTVWDDVLESRNLLEILSAGEICLKYRDSFCENYSKNYGYVGNWEGFNCCFLNLYTMGSEAFGKYALEDFSICVVYVHDGTKYTVSLYSTKIDVSVIAKKYGGGGHTEASGFICDKLPFEKFSLGRQDKALNEGFRRIQEKRI